MVLQKKKYSTKEKKDTVQRKILSSFVNTLIICTNVSFLAWFMFMENGQIFLSPFRIYQQKGNLNVTQKDLG